MFDISVIELGVLVFITIIVIVLISLVQAYKEIEVKNVDNLQNISDRVDELSGNLKVAINDIELIRRSIDMPENRDV